MLFGKAQQKPVTHEAFKLLDAHADLPAGKMFDLRADGELLKVKEIAGKSEAVMKLSQITDLYYGLSTEITVKKDSPIGRAFVGGFLFGGAGAVVGAMTASTKEKSKRLICFIISYAGSDGSDQIIKFEDSRLYKGKQFAQYLADLCGIELGRTDSGANVTVL